MRALLQTKTREKVSVSKVLEIEKLTGAQKEKLRLAVGRGLWEQILKGDPLSVSTVSLIRAKMRSHHLIPEYIWEDED